MGPNKPTCNHTSSEYMAGADSHAFSGPFSIQPLPSPSLIPPFLSTHILLPQPEHSGRRRSHPAGASYQIRKKRYLCPSKKPPSLKKPLGLNRGASKHCHCDSCLVSPQSCWPAALLWPPPPQLPSPLSPPRPAPFQGHSQAQSWLSSLQAPRLSSLSLALGSRASTPLWLLPRAQAIGSLLLDWLWAWVDVVHAAAAPYSTCSCLEGYTD